MNKKIKITVVSLLVVSFFQMYAQEYTTKEIVIQKNDPEYGEVEKVVVYYNAKGESVQNDAIFTVPFSRKTGLKQQKTFMNNGIIYKYEMYYTEEKVAETNCKQATEYINNGQVVGVKYFFINNESLELTNTMYTRFGKLPARRLDYFEKNMFKKPNKANELVIELMPGISNINITDDIIELSVAEKELIKHATMNLFRHDFSNEYKHKIGVMENGEKFYIFMTEDEISQYTNSQKTIAYFYVGGDIKGITFLCMNVFK